MSTNLAHQLTETVVAASPSGELVEPIVGPDRARLGVAASRWARHGLRLYPRGRVGTLLDWADAGFLMCDQDGRVYVRVPATIGEGMVVDRRVSGLAVRALLRARRLVVAAPGAPLTLTRQGRVALRRWWRSNVRARMLRDLT